MADHALSLQPVTLETIDAWLALSSSVRPGIRERLQASIIDNPGLRRYVWLDHSGPVGGFALEVEAVAATTWRPRVKDGLSDQAAALVLDQSAGRLADLAAAQGARYVETIVKGPDRGQDPWRDALTQSGFEQIAVKCEWTRQAGKALPENAGIDIRACPAEADIVSDLYERSMAGSDDRATVFETGFGEPLGPADLVLIASVDQLDAALCASLHEPGAPQAWIKYVGVADAFRHRGLARCLLVEVLRRLEKAGAQTVRCLIDTENHASIALHRSLGFEKTDQCGACFYRVIG